MYLKNSHVCRWGWSQGTYKQVRQLSLLAGTVRYVWLPPRPSVISCFLSKLLSAENGFLSRLSAWLGLALPKVSAVSVSRGQTRQEAIDHAQQSRQKARNHGRFRRKPNRTDNFGRKRKLAD